MTRLLTLVVLAIVLVSTLGEAKSQRIHVTAQVVQQTFTGDPANLQLGDRLITSVGLSGMRVGTGEGVCTIVSLPPLDTLVQCLLTAVFTEGQLIFGGVAPLPEDRAVAHLGILGGTDDFRKARGDATIVVTTPEFMDVTFDLDLPVLP